MSWLWLLDRDPRSSQKTNKFVAVFLDQPHRVVIGILDCKQFHPTIAAAVVDGKRVCQRNPPVRRPLYQQDGAGDPAGGVYGGNIRVAIPDNPLDVTKHPADDDSRESETFQVAAHHPFRMSKCGNADYR